jgi:hypothetical protein
MNASDKIIAATLITVAVIAKRIINLEKDFSLLNAILFAINNEVFNAVKSLIRLIKSSVHRTFLPTGHLF